MGVFSAAKVLADATKNVHTYTRRRRAVSTGNGGVSTASRLFSTAEESVSTAGASMPVSTAGMVQKANTPSSVAPKDKGKGIMTESEPEQTKIKLRQRQERAGYEAAVRLQEQLDEEERQRIARIGEASGTGKEHSTEKEKELSQEDLQQMMMVVPVKEVYVEALQVKYPIIDSKIYSEDTRRYWRINRVGNHTKAYQTFDDMLKKFNRDALDKL
ncbi:hypothetical protein Tco_1349132 [Tanacetum coccineum]